MENILHRSLGGVMSTTKVRLPHGKEITISDVLKFCFEMNDTDLSIMLYLLEHGPKTVEELAKSLHINRSSVNRSLLKLLKTGLVERERIKREGRVGRPKYLYKCKSYEYIKEVLSSKFKICVNAATRLIEELKPLSRSDVKS